MRYRVTSNTCADIRRQMGYNLSMPQMNELSRVSANRVSGILRVPGLIATLFCAGLFAVAGCAGDKDQTQTSASLGSSESSGGQFEEVIFGDDCKNAQVYTQGDLRITDGKANIIPERLESLDKFMAMSDGMLDMSNTPLISFSPDAVNQLQQSTTRSIEADPGRIPPSRFYAYGETTTDSTNAYDGELNDGLGLCAR